MRFGDLSEAIFMNKYNHMFNMDEEERQVEAKDMLHARDLERQYLFFSPGNIQHSEFYSKKLDRFKFYNICKPGHRKGRVKFSQKLTVTMVLK